MPSDPDTPEFARIDWSERDPPSARPGPRTIGFLVTMAAVLAAVGLQYGTDSALGPELSPTAWLFTGAVVVAGWYLALPVARNPQLRSRLVDGLSRTWLRVASTAFLGLLVVGGAYGAWVARETPTRVFANQPPVFFSATDAVIGECIGTLSDGRCQGTITHPLGTGPHGTDMLRLIVEGATVTVQLVAVVGLFVCSIALVVGSVAGYRGGRIDDLLMQYIDIQGTIPAFVVYIILLYVFGRSLVLLVLVFGLLNWGSVARAVRSEAKIVANENYVRAASNYGVGQLGVLRRHIIPNVAGTAVVATTQLMPRIVLIEAALSFMALTDATVQSWGRTIGVGFQTLHAFQNIWWVTTIPVLCIAATVVSLTIVGDALRDVVDPETDH